MKRFLKQVDTSKSFTQQSNIKNTHAYQASNSSRCGGDGRDNLAGDALHLQPAGRLDVVVGCSQILERM